MFGGGNERAQVQRASDIANAIGYVTDPFSSFEQTGRNVREQLEGGRPITTQDYINLATPAAAELLGVAGSRLARSAPVQRLAGWLGETKPRLVDPNFIEGRFKVVPRGAAPAASTAPLQPQLAVRPTPLRVTGPEPIPALPARERVRPQYIRTLESPFIIIRRENLRQEPIPEAVSETSLAALRELSQNRSRSPAIRVADEAAIEARGVPYDIKEAKPISSLKRQAAIGRAFQEAVSGSPEYKSALFERFGEMLPQVVEQAGAQNIDQLTEAAYRKLGQEVTHQFDKLPLEFRYHEGAGEYPSSTAMIQDALGRGRLNVFSGGEPHEFLGVRDPVTGLTQNEMFRAVHDYLGHVVPASRFGPSGEEIAYAAHAQQLSPLAQLALLSETRGQNSFVNYTPVNADITAAMNTLRRQQTERRALARRAARGDKEASSLLDLLPSQEEITSRLRELGQQTQFAEQKAVLLPPEFLETMTPGTTPSWLREVMNVASPSSARGVHISINPDLEFTDPSFYGRGHQGQEYSMVRKQKLPLRTYYYSGPEGTVKPEIAVMGQVAGKMVKGPRYAYEADLRNLYDLQEDPEGLIKLSQAYNLPSYRPVMPYYMMQQENLLNLEGTSIIPDLERLVRDYGYTGYLTDMGSQRAAAVFDPIFGLRPIERGPEGFSEGGQVMPLENRNGHHLRHDQSEVPEGTT